MDYLLLFCEYVYNLVLPIKVVGISHYNLEYGKIIDHITKLTDKLNLTITSKGNYYILLEKSFPAISVAQSVSEELSYKILEYNHHSLKGNIEGKKSILLKLASKLEPKRKILQSIDSTLDKNLFLSFNKFNIRHNNCDNSDESNYTTQFANLNNEEQEELYDWTYNQSLIAFIKLENINLNEKFKNIKYKIDIKIVD